MEFVCSSGNGHRLNVVNTDSYFGDDEVTIDVPTYASFVSTIICKLVSSTS